jgi:hypothetical protein
VGLLGTPPAPSGGGVVEWLDGPSPVDGQYLARVVGGYWVVFAGDRYGRAANVARALRAGHILFGAGSFCVLEGPYGHTPFPIIAAPVAPAVEHQLSMWSDTSGGFWLGTEDMILFDRVLDPVGNEYEVRGLVATEGSALHDILPDVSRDLDPPFYFFPDLASGERFLREVLDPNTPANMPIQSARQAAFRPAEKIIAGRSAEDLALFDNRDDRDAAAAELAKLDATAFALLSVSAGQLPPDTDTRRKYLEILIDAGGEAEERAAVEIVKSAKDRAELDDLLDDDLKTVITASLNYELWTFLAVVGERFGSQDPITWQEIATFLYDVAPGLAGLFSITAIEGLDANGWPIIKFNLLDDLYIAADTLLDNIIGTLQGVWTLLTNPKSLVIALYGLIEMALMFRLADPPISWGPAVQYRDALFSGLARKAIAALRGAQLMQMTGPVADEIKWTIAWEIIAWFTGPGEAKAPKTARNLTRDLAELSRGAKAVAKVVSEAEQAAAVAKLERMGALVAREMKIAEARDATRLLTMLPEEELASLTTKAKNVSLENVDEVAQIPDDDLRKALQAVPDKLDILRAAENSMGPLSDDALKALQRLRNHPDLKKLTDAEVARYIRTLTGELDGIPPQLRGERLELALRAIYAMPAGAAETRTLTFFQRLVEFPEISSFMIQHGWEVTKIMLDRAQRKMDRLATYIAAIDRMVEASPQADKAAELNRIVKAIKDGDATIWTDISKHFERNVINVGWKLGDAGTSSRADILASRDIAKFTELTYGMAPGPRGVIFEEWMWPYLKKVYGLGDDVKRERITVFLDENPELAKWVDEELLEKFEGRECFVTDAFVKDPVVQEYFVFEGKGTFVEGGGTVPSMQLQAYESMKLVDEVTVWIGDATQPQKIKIKNMIYVFPNRAGAEQSATKIANRAGEAWFFEGQGLEKLR